MAKRRDYKREYELSKQRGERDKDKIVAAHVSPEILDAFKAKTKKDGTKPGTLIKEWIIRYLSEK